MPPAGLFRATVSVDLGERHRLGMRAALAAEQGVFDDQSLGAVIAGRPKHGQDERTELGVLLAHTSSTEPADA
jgi:hypothetical protein